MKNKLFANFGHFPHFPQFNGFHHISFARFGFPHFPGGHGGGDSSMLIVGAGVLCLLGLAVLAFSGRKEDKQ